MTFTPRTIAAGAAFCLVAALGVSVLLERRAPKPTPEQAVAHERTAVATAVSAHADTVFAVDTLRIGGTRVAYRRATDTLRLTDTVQVKGALAKADTVIRLDSVAIADAARSIAAHGVTEAALRSELALAQQAHAPPRFSASASALYDPIARTPAASLDGAFRVIGRWSLVARGEQRFATGESPRAYVGVQVRY